MSPLPARLFQPSIHRNSLPLLTFSPAPSSEYWSPLTTALLTLLFAALTDHQQLTENPATLSPCPATLTRRVNHNPFVCHSYKKHPGVGGVTAFKRQIFDSPHSLRTERSGFRVSVLVFQFPLATRRSPLATIPFRIRTYEKTPGGRGPKNLASTQMLPLFSTASRHPVHRNASNSNRFMRLFLNPLDTRVCGHLSFSAARLPARRSLRPGWGGAVYPELLGALSSSPLRFASLSQHARPQ